MIKTTNIRHIERKKTTNKDVLTCSFVFFTFLPCVINHDVFFFPFIHKKYYMSLIRMHRFARLSSAQLDYLVLGASYRTNFDVLGWYEAFDSFFLSPRTISYLCLEQKKSEDLERVEAVDRIMVK